jgi:glycerol-3-phosphate acyltransferase PlsY
MQTMIAVSMIVLGYLSGTVNYAIAVTWAVVGVDNRTLRNRNPGPANVSRNVGKGWAANAWLDVTLFDGVTLGGIRGRCRSSCS